MALERLKFNVTREVIDVFENAQHPQTIKRIVLTVKSGDQVCLFEKYDNPKTLIAEINNLVWRLERIADWLLLFVGEDNGEED